MFMPEYLFLCEIDIISRMFSLGSMILFKNNTFESFFFVYESFSLQLKL